MFWLSLDGCRAIVFKYRLDDRTRHEINKSKLTTPENEIMLLLELIGQ